MKLKKVRFSFGFLKFYFYLCKIKGKAEFRSIFYYFTIMEERIKLLMEHEHLNQQLFADFLGVSSATISSIINKKSRPTLKIVEAIRRKIPNISLDWLVFGTGPMFLDDKNKTATPTPTPTASSASEPVLDFSDDNEASKNVASPSNFNNGVNTTPKNKETVTVKYVDKPQRHISQIMVIYDDQTLETFVPKK